LVKNFRKFFIAARRKVWAASLAASPPGPRRRSQYNNFIVLLVIKACLKNAKTLPQGVFSAEASLIPPPESRQDSCGKPPCPAKNCPASAFRQFSNKA